MLMDGYIRGFGSGVHTWRKTRIFWLCSCLQLEWLCWYLLWLSIINTVCLIRTRTKSALCITCVFVCVCVARTQTVLSNDLNLENLFNTVSENYTCSCSCILLYSLMARVISSF